MQQQRKNTKPRFHIAKAVSFFVWKADKVFLLYDSGEYIYGIGNEFYSGDWRNNKKSGKGTKTEADGSIYMGEVRPPACAGPLVLTVSFSKF